MAPERCPSHRSGVAFYRGRYSDWRSIRGLDTPRPVGRKPNSCPDAQYLADVWHSRSFEARELTERWLKEQAERTLQDYEVTDGNNAWQRAVEEVQRAYPGTEGWLWSCSASEGGHGRWVPNSQGSGVGGWLQFMPGTWSGFFRNALSDVTARGFRVPDAAASWYSPLGQALAGAWGITHGMRHHWAGSGCQ